MIVASSHPARGVALLIVLVALVATTTALLGLARLTMTCTIDRSFGTKRMLADDLLMPADLAACRWLSEKSALVVLPVDIENSSPGVRVFDSQWSVPDRSGEAACRLTITAWDQCASFPAALFQSDSARLFDGTREMAALANTGTRSPFTPGLDLFERAQQMAVSAHRIFPRAERDQGSDDGPVLGGWGALATHNPLPAGSSVDPASTDDRSESTRVFRVNVSTAPMPMIEAMLRHARAGSPAVYAQIVAARTQRRRPNLDVLSSKSTGVDVTTPAAFRQLQPEFATFSNCWSLRIDAQVGPVRKSWWAVYANTSSSWECVQRLVIDE